MSDSWYAGVAAGVGIGVAAEHGLWWGLCWYVIVVVASSVVRAVAS